MKADDCILFQITRTGQTGRKFFKTMLQGMELTPAQAIVLNFLYDEDSIPASLLGERAAIDGATLTGLTDRLESAGFVERRPRPGDRRAMLICLTESGKEKAGKVKDMMIQYNREFLSSLSKDEEKVFRKVMNKLYDRFQGNTDL